METPNNFVSELPLLDDIKFQLISEDMSNLVSRLEAWKEQNRGAKFVSMQFEIRQLSIGSPFGSVLIAYIPPSK